MTAYVNRAYFAVSNTPGSSGNFTVSTAESGYRTLGSADNGKFFDVMAIEGTSWEVRTGCTYTHSGTSLSRGTLEESSTGSAITFTSAVKVMVVNAAKRIGQFDIAAQAITPGGRLTLTSNTPVTTSDVTGATTIYYTPYIHNVIVLWDGMNWVPVTFAETSHALGTMTSGANYDVFGYLSSGALALEKLIWTSDTARATAVTLQDGRYCKSGDKTRLYLGTFRSTSTTATEDSEGGTTSTVGGKRFLWNAYNRVTRSLRVLDQTDSWTYNSTTIRNARGQTTPSNAVEFVVGLDEDTAEATLLAYAYTADGVDIGNAGIGFNQTALDGTNVPFYLGSIVSGGGGVSIGHWEGIPRVGYNYLQWCEACALGTITFAGDNGGSVEQSGLQARVTA
jgi:hypothetical protein